MVTENRNKSAQICLTDFYKGAKTIQWRKQRLFNNGAEVTGYTAAKKINLAVSLTPYPKINSKWTIVINTKHKTLGDGEVENLEYSARQRVI